MFSNHHVDVRDRQQQLLAFRDTEVVDDFAHRSRHGIGREFLDHQSAGQVLRIRDQFTHLVGVFFAEQFDNLGRVLVIEFCEYVRAMVARQFLDDGRRVGCRHLLDQVRRVSVRQFLDQGGRAVGGDYGE